MNRAYNFGAGPAMLPLELLTEVQSELLNWQDLGVSVLEVGHRTKEFTQLMDDTEQLFRKLLSIPDNYHVLFLGGPTRLQFGMIPHNLISDGQQAGYLITGLWSSMAFEEAIRIKKAYCIASNSASIAQNILSIPASSDWNFQDNTAYVYYTPNETINGLRCSTPPKYSAIPLVADMTSCLFVEPIEIRDYGLIFAGAQKNIANAGLTVVIIRDDLIKTITNESSMTLLDYRTYVTSRSLYATPPTFNCYIALKMLQWIDRQGGVQELYKVALKKSAKLYQFIDSSSCYHCNIAEDARSHINICFRLFDSSFEELFIEKANNNGLLALRGHRAIGGLRASLYNSMPMEGVDYLVEFMDNFARRYG